jgi:pimeloyl-ACP methyl ester carboxylesterase
MLRTSPAILRSLVFATAIAIVAPGGAASVLAAPGPTFATLRAAGQAEVMGVFVRPPQAQPNGQPLQVVIALHGMAGNGADFGGALGSLADEYGWLLVAPTIKYGDWTDPNQIVREEPALIAWLSDYVNALSARTGYDVQPKVLLFGHSRGAQLALRFSEVHPDQVLGVAALSAGTYTLPLPTDAHGDALDFPFGIADLARADGGQAFDPSSFKALPIWIGVGAADANPRDVPSAWTPYLGLTRVDRARTFADALRSQGGDVSLTVFPDTDHGLTDAMRSAGFTMLEGDVESAQTSAQ